MRISKFTEIFKVQGRNYLFNFGTGAIDEVEDYLIEEIKRLR